MAKFLAFYRIISIDHAPPLARYKRTLSGSCEAVPPQSVIPITWDVLPPMTPRLLESNQQHAAAALVAQWACYARNSEILALTKRDIALLRYVRIFHYKTPILGVNIQYVKTGSHQFTHIEDPELISSLCCHLQSNASNQLVFSISYADYLAAINTAAGYLQLSLRVTTRSARIGRALHDFLSGSSTEAIASIDRRASLSSLQHYLKNGRS